MYIAFEGPDNTGKSTSARKLAYDGHPIYNATRDVHEAAQYSPRRPTELPIVYDRIDWLTHMVYRLAMPLRTWNDDRPRTVFAMPETHLVIKIHDPELVDSIEDELYESKSLGPVNLAYWRTAEWLVQMNMDQDFALFRTISMMVVRNDVAAGTFSQQLVGFSSPVTDPERADHFHVESDETLLELLYYEDQQRL